MKIKNNYIWLSVLWILSTLFDTVFCVVNFVDGSLIYGLIFLFLSVSFSFVSGILLNKAILVYWHNKEVDWLHDFAKELSQEQNKPFEEFEND